MNTKCLGLLSRAPRALIVAVVLATFMWSQHETQRHTLLHLADQLSRHHEQGLQKSGAELSCVECGLLAGGTHAVPGGAMPFPADVVNFARIAWVFVSRAVSPGSYYSSRAPPVLL